MISWLQTNLQKHFRFLFIILLGVVIVAFVFTIGAAPGIGDGRQDIPNLRFFEFELTTDSQRQQFFNEAYYSSLLSGAPMSQEQLNQYAFNRAAALHLANIHNLPGPNTEQLTKHIQELGMFMGPDQTFSRDAYSRFRDEIRASGQISEGQLSRIMEDDFRINQVFEVLSGPGFVLESEVIEELKLDQTLWSVAVAEIDLNEFEPEIDDSTEKLEAFFAQNSFRYTAPARRVISYLEFRALDYMSEIEASDSDIRSYFDLNQSRYTKTVEAEKSEDDQNNEAEASETQTVQLTFEEARDQVEFDYKLDQARELSRKNAESIGLAIVELDNATDASQSLSLERIETLAEQKDIQIKHTTPFARNERPLGLSWSQNLIATSFQLTENHIYSQPIIEGDSTYILVLENENPEFVPSFTTVEAQVKEDYRQEESRRLRTEHANQIAAELNELDTSAFKEAESKGMTISEFSNFKRRDTIEGLDSGLIFSVMSLDVGDVSNATIREDKGYIIQVVGKETPAIDSSNEEFETRMTALAGNYERYAVSQYISKLASDELVRAGLATAPN
ncbi:MAG TPA: hypothetical protein DIV79_04445 [Opitutae bacterium]|nr:hypothetical protein [Opitutaceae bacterium]HCR29249.1 hypothetical protein [Opitutae bacterium]